MWTLLVSTKKGFSEPREWEPFYWASRYYLNQENGGHYKLALRRYNPDQEIGDTAN